MDILLINAAILLSMIGGVFYIIYQRKKFAHTGQESTYSISFITVLLFINPLFGLALNLFIFYKLNELSFLAWGVLDLIGVLFYFIYARKKQSYA